MDKEPIKAPDAFRTISEVAQDLDLPQHVLRFWETRFTQIKPMKRGGGRRYYRPEDVDLLRGIRTLLYSEGFTIRGVQRLMKENGPAFVVNAGQTGAAPGRKTAARTAPAESESVSQPVSEPEDEGPGAAAAAARDEGPRAAAAAPPLAAAPPREPDSATTTLGGLSREGRRRIEAALADLLDAKRLLDTVR